MLFKVFYKKMFKKISIFEVGIIHVCMFLRTGLWIIKRAMENL